MKGLKVLRLLLGLAVLVGTIIIVLTTSVTGSADPPCVDCPQYEQWAQTRDRQHLNSSILLVSIGLVSIGSLIGFVVVTKRLKEKRILDSLPR